MLALPNIEIKQFGRNKKGHRVMLVLSMLQATYNGSDSYTAEELKENIYWQYFCGYEYMHQDMMDRKRLYVDSVMIWEKKSVMRF